MNEFAWAPTVSPTAPADHAHQQPGQQVCADKCQALMKSVLTEMENQMTSSSVRNEAVEFIHCKTR